MAAIHDETALDCKRSPPNETGVRAGVGQARSEQAGVAQRDAGIPLTRHDQAWVRHPVQPRKAGPARDRRTAGRRSRADRGPVQSRPRLVGEDARPMRGAPTGDMRDGEREQTRVVVAGWRRQHQRRHRARRDPAEARRGGAQHEPAERSGACRASSWQARRRRSIRARRHARASARPPARGRRGPSPASAAEGRAVATDRRRVDRMRSARGYRRAAGKAPTCRGRPDAGDQQQRASRAPASDAQAQSRGPHERRIPVHAETIPR
jgi:hypothetical protein